MGWVGFVQLLEPGGVPRQLYGKTLEYAVRNLNIMRKQYSMPRFCVGAFLVTCHDVSGRCVCCCGWVPGGAIGVAGRGAGGFGTHARNHESSAVPHLPGKCPSQVQGGWGGGVGTQNPSREPNATIEACIGEKSWAGDCVWSMTGRVFCVDP